MQFLRPVSSFDFISKVDISRLGLSIYSLGVIRVFFKVKVIKADLIIAVG